LLTLIEIESFLDQYFAPQNIEFTQTDFLETTDRFLTLFTYILLSEPHKHVGGGYAKVAEAWHTFQRVLQSIFKEVASAGRK